MAQSCREAGDISGVEFSLFLGLDNPHLALLRLLACRKSERAEALAMIEAHADRPRPFALAADLRYGAEDFVNDVRSMDERPRVVKSQVHRRGGSAIDSGTTRQSCCAASQRVRRHIEVGFSWMKAVAGLDRRGFQRRRPRIPT